MKITQETKLEYDYSSDTVINLNGTKCFYYENRNYLDTYQIRTIDTERLIVCAESKEVLLNYLISQHATIE